MHHERRNQNQIEVRRIGPAQRLDTITLWRGDVACDALVLKHVGEGRLDLLVDGLNGTLTADYHLFRGVGMKGGGGQVGWTLKATGQARDRTPRIGDRVRFLERLGDDRSPLLGDEPGVVNRVHDDGVTVDLVLEERECYRKGGRFFHDAEAARAVQGFAEVVPYIATGVRHGLVERGFMWTDELDGGPIVDPHPPIGLCIARRSVDDQLRLLGLAAAKAAERTSGDVDPWHGHEGGDVDATMKLLGRQG